MFRLSLVSAVAAVVASSSLACEGDECDASSLLQTQEIAQGGKCTGSDPMCAQLHGQGACETYGKDGCSWTTSLLQTKAEEIAQGGKCMGSDPMCAQLHGQAACETYGKDDCSWTTSLLQTKAEEIAQGGKCMGSDPTCAQLKGQSACETYGKDPGCSWTQTRLVEIKDHLQTGD